jgi:pimeloyl-ACP methyl ester carboxylesterase
MDTAQHERIAGAASHRADCRLSSAIIVCAILLAGCTRSALRNQQTLWLASLKTPSPSADGTCWDCGGPAVDAEAVVGCEWIGAVSHAESLLAAAKRLDADRREGCVDLYFRSALAAWTVLETAAGVPPLAAEHQLAGEIYGRSLEGLIRAGQRYGRLDPRNHLIVEDRGARRVVPIAYYGFAWRPGDFCQLFPAEDFQSRDIAVSYRWAGLGTPLVAVRNAPHEELFFRPRHPFAVTAVLRPSKPSGPSGQDPVVLPDTPSSSVVLEFYNPCVFDRMAVGDVSIALARDLTAPWALVQKETPQRYLEGFLAPFDTDVQPKLLMVAPYVRGKIPVVFIHGLLSDPMTWVDVANELHAQPDLCRQYQFWAFRYPTGGDLLGSAADLREKLRLARELCDPGHNDRAMERIVLVGHSMGGLVARLQVSYSLDTLWRQAAEQPLEAVRAAPAVREELRRDFFFDPSPLVSRVVFIGTPHRGSSWSRRLVGRIGSSLVRYSGEAAQQYQTLMADNRDVFYPYLWDSRPTCVDLLEPTSPLLDGIARMPFGACVKRHSIIGTGGATLFEEPGDGVVPVSSARLSGVCSELCVPVRHEKLHHDPATLAELMRILREHAASECRAVSNALQAALSWPDSGATPEVRKTRPSSP